MPLPLLGLLAAGAAAVTGVAGHMCAKDTNKRAQEILEDAENIYNQGRLELKKTQDETEESLLKLGYSKKNILETSVHQFLESYKKIKEIQVQNSVGLEEIANFSIKNHEALELQEMSDIYQEAFSKGAAGAATGAVVALAVSGSLPVVTGVLSTAGSLAIAGNIGAAAGLAGSAFSFAATMTPLAAIAAPVILFTGISSSIKADENLEKAKVCYAQANAAVEEMKVSQTLYQAIAKRADMFDETLFELNKMFSYCSSLLERVTRKKCGFFKKKITQKDLNENEIKLIAVTRSLAGAVKALIDAPILTPEGEISDESCLIHDNTVKKIPSFSEAVEEIKKCEFKQAKPLKEKKIKQNGKKSKFVLVAAIVLAFIGIFFYFSNTEEKELNLVNGFTEISNISNSKNIEENSEIDTLDNIESEDNLNSSDNLQKVAITNEVNNKYSGPERNQFIFLNGKTVFVDENGYIVE